LEGADEWIEKLREEVAKQEKINNATCAALTEARTRAALPFAKAVMNELAQLNMAKAEFSLEIVPQKRSRTGDDRVEFYLAPNVGERRMPVREAASGGELSRLMLALQTLLAGKTEIPTLVFDEIDANIGGATATVIGHKMCSIASKHQILCVTHFPQVAKEAQHHLRIAKQEIEGRTVTQVTCLDAGTRTAELARMQGS
jgi:DNA repair protein RecN (Recombination protein N)